MSVLDEQVANGAGELEQTRAAGKDTWLSGPGDLEDVYVDVDGIGLVHVRALSAGQHARINDACLTMRGETMKLDTGRMNVLKFSVAVIDDETNTPMFDESEANQLAHKYGHAFDTVIKTIDEISKASEEDVQKARRRFRPRR